MSIPFPACFVLHRRSSCDDRSHPLPLEPLRHCLACTLQKLAWHKIIETVDLRRSQAQIGLSSPSLEVCLRHFRVENSWKTCVAPTIDQLCGHHPPAPQEVQYGLSNPSNCFTAYLWTIPSKQHQPLINRNESWVFFLLMILKLRFFIISLACQSSLAISFKSAFRLSSQNKISKRSRKWLQTESPAPCHSKCPTERPGCLWAAVLSKCHATRTKTKADFWTFLKNA